MKKICQKVRQIIQQVLWGDRSLVSKKDAKFVDEHIRRCPDCQEWFDEQKVKYAIALLRKK